MASEPSLLGPSIDQSFNGHVRRAVFPASVTLVGLTAIALGGYYTYQVTHDLQVKEFENKYNNLAGSAVILLREGLDDSIRGTRAVSAVIGSTFPTADMWPFVYLYDYHTATMALNHDLMVNFAPLVKPEEASEFETFAYASYNATYDLPVAQSSFGEGIFALVNSSCFDCARYRDVSGNTSYGSPNQILVPILQGNSSVLMFNVHSNPLRGHAVDAMIRCTSTATTVAEMCTCGAISPPTFSYVDPTFLTSILYFPVFPIRNSTTLTGITMVRFRWNDFFATLFPSDAPQMHCVLRADDEVFTFVIERGHVVEFQRKDIHEADMNKYARTASITSRTSLQSAITTYTVTIYPTQRFRRDYIDDGPLLVTLIVAVVLFILFAAAGCGWYFYQLRRRDAKSTAVSKAKRMFIRYISHEIRTPLNTVSLGLSLLLSEMAPGTVSSVERSTLYNSNNTITTHHNSYNNSHSNITASSATICSDSREWCKLVAELIENSQCAVMLLDDLLSFEQFEQGSLSTSQPQQQQGAGEKQVLPVWELLRSVVASFTVRAKLSDVTLLTEMPTDPQREEQEPSAERRAALEALRVLGNETQLKRVISSLLSNALQFSHEGGQITIACSWIERSFPQGTSSKHLQQSPPVSPLARNNSALSHLYEQGRARSNSMDRAARQHSHNSSSWEGSRTGLSRAGVVRVAVTDQGAGMTPEQTAQVFGKGKRFSLSALQAGQGSGIGLFVCKIIAEQHHATIKVTSPGVGLGSTYTLDLPVFTAPAQRMHPEGQDERGDQDGQDGSARLTGRRLLLQPVSPVRSPARGDSFPAGYMEHKGNEETELKLSNEAKEQDHTGRVLAMAGACVDGAAADGAVAEGAAQATPPAAVDPSRANKVPFVPGTTLPATQPDIQVVGLFTHKRILVVDDAPSNRKMLVRVLAKQGHVCEQAHDGQVAVDMFQEAENKNMPYDMILMDFEMPVMNGPTATAKLRELGCTVPIMGVTGNVLPMDVEYFMAQGADAVLPKPLKLSALEAEWKKKVEEEQLLHHDVDLDV